MSGRSKPERLVSLLDLRMPDCDETFLNCQRVRMAGIFCCKLDLVWIPNTVLVTVR